MNLDHRERVGELMDDPTLDEREHERALRALARLNRLSAAHRPIVHVIRQWNRDGFDLLDVASGSGDVLMATLRALRRDVRAHACDISPVARARIERRAEDAGAGVRVFTADALEPGALGEASYDVAMNSLFLHHLTRDDAVGLLAAMRNALRPSGLLVVSDLRRSRLNYAMALVASRLLTRASVVHTDALRSVRAAFTMDEARAIAADAGLGEATITPAWPERFVLSWVKA